LGGLHYEENLKNLRACARAIFWNLKSTYLWWYKNFSSCLTTDTLLICCKEQTANDLQGSNTCALWPA